jgi:PAS domain S-box-containing protein
MAGATALGFVLVGSAVLLLTRRRVTQAQILGWLALAGGSIAVLGYLYGVRSLYSTGPYSTTALHSALGMAVAAAGVLAAVPDGLLSRIATGSSPGELLLRRVLPIVVIGMPVLGWLTLEGEQRGWYDSDLGKAFLIIGSVAFVGVVAWRASVAIDRAEAGLIRARQDLIDANAMLETRVAERTSQLSRSETRFRALLEAAPDAMIIVNGAGQIVLVNQQTERLLGYGSSELIGRGIDMLVPEAARGMHASFRAEYAADPRPHSMGAGLDLFAVHKDGDEVAVEISLSPLATDQGMLVTAAIRDVTHRKMAERELQRALEAEREAVERLRGLDEMKDTFLRAVSHDLRTPLSVILWLAEALGKDGMDLSSAESRESVERIAANARALDRLVVDLLDVDRLKERAELGGVEADVGALVRNVVKTSAVLDKRQVLVQAEGVIAVVDPAKVERIVENLLANVTRHAGPKSPVWVRVEPDQGGVLIAVEDAGPGVPVEFREAIFRPFERGVPRRDASGIGVGLSLVRSFAALHGGRAWVEDREGGGSSFRVWLPAGRED